MVNWIFFDVGNTLFIDEPLVALCWAELYAALKGSGHSLTFEELMAKREHLIQQTQDSVPFRTIGREMLGEQGWIQVDERVKAKFLQDYFAYNFVLEGIEGILAQLARKYNLAVAANQPEKCRQALDTAGLLKYFKVVGISDEMGLSKPSPKFFEALLAAASCTASEAIMVGDRIDNDIVPAKGVGMYAIWFNLSPDVQGYIPKSDLERVYIESLYRAPSRGSGYPQGSVEADITVTAPDQLVAAVETIAGATP